MANPEEQMNTKRLATYVASIVLSLRAKSWADEPKVLSEFCRMTSGSLLETQARRGGGDSSIIAVGPLRWELRTDSRSRLVDVAATLFWISVGHEAQEEEEAKATALDRFVASEKAVTKVLGIAGNRGTNEKEEGSAQEDLLRVSWPLREAELELQFQREGREMPFDVTMTIRPRTSNTTGQKRKS